jgi:RsiW-degrading membrane proteinase PrsW (M82 family)
MNNIENVMNKPKTAGLFFMVLAIVLMILGCKAYDSTASVISFVHTGAPTQGAVWLILASILAAITGIFRYTSDSSDNGDWTV